jgi:hypothetical protein
MPEFDPNSMMPQGGFYQVADVLDMTATLPVSFSPVLRLEKATPAQIAHIHFMFGFVGGNSSPNRFYENTYAQVINGPVTTFVATPLDPPLWRYYILSFAGGGGLDLPAFLLAANLGEPPLNFFLNFLSAEPFGVGDKRGWGGDSAQAADWYMPPNIWETPPVVFDDTSVARLQSAFTAVASLDTAAYPAIVRALNAFQSLKRLPRNSDMQVMGMFSIIEMLLTHNPNDKEIGDSLMHQIRHKIALLSPRFSLPLDYSPFPTATNELKVWNTLYSLRSLIAHGGEVNFADNKLRLLENRGTALAFLSTATRRLLRHSLNEPQLIDSLKPI